MLRRRVVCGLLASGAFVRTASAAESFFEGASRVSVARLVEELEVVAEAMLDSEDVQADFNAFVEQHGLEPSEALRRDHAKVRLAFEATRDGGWWHLRWDITNRKPNSEAIWKQWRKNPSLSHDDTILPSATAECDELSALFAFLVRRLGVQHVGLFWPVWNHVVAVWTIPQGEVTHRIVVPTSQIFLSAEATLGTDEFNPWKQKTIYTYRRKDVSLRSTVPGALAEFFIAQAWAHAMTPQAEQQALRNARSAQLDGS